MPDLKPFLVSGLALGSIYALSGVGVVVLFRASGVLNFAYGAIGALAAFVTWQLADDGQGMALAIVGGLVVSAALSAAIGVLLGARLANRDLIERACVTVGVALAVLGLLLVIWSDTPRTLSLPTDETGFVAFDVHVNLTEIVALVLALAITIGMSVYLRATSTGLAMRAMACDRELSGTLGIRLLRVETIAWTISGVLAGASGILLANLISLEAAGLTFLVIAALAAAVIGRFRSLWLTLAGGLLIGLVQSCATPFQSVTEYRSAAPFVLAILALLLIPGASLRGASDR